MSNITTHVLDTSRGEPAPGVPVTLESQGPGGAWTPLASAATDADGRVRTFLPAAQRLEPGTYRLRFDTAAYFAARAQQAFFPWVEVAFTIRDPSRHHHVPLLLSAFGYSTYRGS